MNFDQAFVELVGNEGKLSLDPNDRGNWTGGRIGVGKLLGSKYGISAASYPTLDIPNLTLDQAKAIYAKDFWGQAGCDAVPDAIKFDLFDFAVNSGPRRAAVALQKAVGADQDGSIGPLTVAAIGAMNAYQVLHRLSALRALLMTGDPAWLTQGKGWMVRLANNALRA